jgi:uncharacterized membrane protein
MSGESGELSPNSCLALLTRHGGARGRTVMPVQGTTITGMRSQVKWGLLLIIIGIILVPFGFPFLLFYAVPLILVGVVIILFRKREELIEPRKE